MSDPIAQALAGTISWAEADRLYHAALAHGHAHDHAHAHAHDHAHDHDAAARAHAAGQLRPAPDGEADDEVVECGRCGAAAVDECEGCEEPMCADHRERCEHCSRNVCRDCTMVGEDDTVLCFACGPDDDADDS